MHEVLARTHSAREEGHTIALEDDELRAGDVGAHERRVRLVSICQRSASSLDDGNHHCRRHHHGQ